MKVSPILLVQNSITSGPSVKPVRGPWCCTMLDLADRGSKQSQMGVSAYVGWEG